MTSPLTLLFCTLANLKSAPPGTLLQGLYFSMYNIDRTLCPPVRDSEVLFYLYTRAIQQSPDLLKLNDDDLLNGSHIDFNKPTKLFFHGALESYKSKDAQEIKNAYLQKEDCNVILVDAKVLFAGPNVLTAANNVEAVGKYTAKFVDYLITNGLNLETFEVIGMSLGGQTTGILARNIKRGRIKKIIAYDPAGVVFDLKPKNQRLDAGDADQVIVIHSNPHQWGTSLSCGTTDVWINGDSAIQPGCDMVSVELRNPGSLGEQVFCSHWLSYRMGVYAINHPETFPILKCANVKKGDCEGSSGIYLGDIPKEAKGDYLVQVGSDVYVKYDLGQL